MSKKSALRRWISRFVMPVAMLAGSTDTATQERAGSFSLRSMAPLKRVKIPLAYSAGKHAAPPR